MLRNPYYKGDIIYKGGRHLGTHDRLTGPTVWAKVQNLLDAHNFVGTAVRLQPRGAYRGTGTAADG
jgi:hypothetical protein